MIKDILKMGGCKTEKEFYKKYPTEESFLEAFPQARPMMEQFSQGGALEAFPQARPIFAKGGALDIEAFPGAAPNVSDYGAKTAGYNYIFQMGGSNGSMASQTDAYGEDPLMKLLADMSAQYSVDSAEMLELIQKLPQDVMQNLRSLAANDPQRAAEVLVEMQQKSKNDPVSMMAREGGSFSTPPTADQFFRKYPSVNFPIAMAQVGGATPYMNTYKEELPGGAIDEYGGSVFNYGQFPAIMMDGGSIPMNSQNSIMSSKLQNFMSKITEYAEKHKQEEMMESMMNQQSMMRRGGMTSLPMHQIPPGQTSGFADLGYKGPYDLGMNDEPDLSGLASTPYSGQYNIGEMNLQGPYQFGDIGKGFLDRWQGFSKTEDTGPTETDPYGIAGSLPGSFQSDRLSQSETPLEAGAGYSPDGTFEGINKAGEAVSVNPEMRPKYYVEGWRPEAGKMMGDKELKDMYKQGSKFKKDWQGKSGVQKAETILAGLAGFNSTLEKQRMRKREEQMADEMTPMNWAGSYQANKGDWDQFGVFRPDKTGFLTQFEGMAAYGGQLPAAKSGLEVKMRAGLGFNANQLSWPVMAGEFSQPDFEVKETIGPVDRDDANLEAEVGETAVTNLSGDGIPEQYKIGGKRHYAGGTPLNLPDNSYIFSRDRSMKIKDKELLAEFGVTKSPRGGVTPADIAKKYKLNEYKKALLDPNSDDLAKSTAQANIENANLKLGKLALIQESMKAFPEGIPMISTPYMEKMGITPDMMPKTMPMKDEAAEENNQARYGGLPKAQFGEWVFNGPSQTGQPAKTVQLPDTVVTETRLPQEKKPFQFNLEGTDFTDPSKPIESTVGNTFITFGNQNAFDKIMETGSYYNPKNNEYVSLDKNMDGKISDDEFNAIKETMDKYKEKLEGYDTGSRKTGIGQMISAFYPESVFGLTNQDRVDDMADIVGNMIDDFQEKKNIYDIRTFNTSQRDNATLKLADIEKRIAEVEKTEMKDFDDAMKLNKLIIEKQRLNDYIKTADKSLEQGRNVFYNNPRTGGIGGFIVNDIVGGDPMKIPSYDIVYPAITTEEAKSIPTAVVDTAVLSNDIPVAGIDSSIYELPQTKDTAVVAQPVVKQQAAPKKAAATREERARQQIGPDWDTWSQEDKDQYLNLKLRKGGSPLPRYQTKGAFTLGYEDIPGYNVAGPDWRLNLPSIGQQLPSKGDYYTTSSGIIWPKSRKDVEPNVDWFRTYPGASDAVWQQYDKDRGFDKWKEDLAQAKGIQSPASEFWVKNVVNPYTSKIPGGKAYVDESLRGAYVPGTEWSTPPIYTQIPDQPEKSNEQKASSGTTPSIPVNTEGITPVSGNIQTPFWTEDIINTGAAFRNLAGVKKLALLPESVFQV